MEVVLITDGGSVDARLTADHTRHTLGDVAAAVLGHDRTPTIVVDGADRSSDATLTDAGVRRGSAIDLTSATSSEPSEPADTSPARRLLVESAGYGGQRHLALDDGTYRIGPTRRVNAPHLAPGPVDDALLVVDVGGEVVTVEAAPGHGAALDGELLLGPTRWVDGPLMIDDRILELAPPDSTEFNRPSGPLTALPLGRSLVPDDRAAAVALDANSGIGIVADPDDAMAILRSIVLAAAIGDHDEATPIDLMIESDRPHVWEWTKWLPTSVRSAHGVVKLLVIDRTDPDTLPIDVPTDCALVAAAASATMLPTRLGSIVEPVGAGRSTAVRATTIVDGSPFEHRRIAPFTLDHDLALHHARAMSRMASSARGSEASPSALTLEPWYVTRAATPTERRALRWRAGDPAHVSVATGSSGPTSPEHVVAAGAIDATRYIVPIGVWADRRSIATLPLIDGRRLAVIGQDDDARADLLALVLEGIGQAEPPSGVRIDLFALAPRGGPLISAERRRRLSLDVADDARDVRQWLERIAAARRPFVVVDGIERVGGPSMRWFAGDDFRHATVVVAASDAPDTAHWTLPWHDRWMTIRLDVGAGTASVVSRHRTREVLLVGHDAHDPDTDQSVRVAATRADIEQADR